ncbi:MAG: hypothetical protein IJ642_02495 [Oscillospiraceae bacterium]|nr:hypothetical protein [Oscillospiraceae bacterium]
MTKKEIEERLCQEMQQNIPDKDALWQRIESSLPEQPVSQPVRRKIHMSAGKGFLTIAACLVLTVAGMQYLKTNKSEHTMTESSAAPAAEAGIAEEAANDNAAMPEEAAEALGSAEDSEISEFSGMLNYQNLNILHNRTIASQVNLSRLGTDGEYFSEDEILQHTEFFIDVRILDGYQDSESGNMHYTLQILDVYGSDLNLSEIELETGSAYILEQNHEYVLPVTADLNLAYECAPQIEKTQDENLIIPNGWYTLMQSDTTPVLYDSYGKDDYFYDRMYLTQDLNLDLLIQKWKSL